MFRKRGDLLLRKAASRCLPVVALLVVVTVALTAGFHATVKASYYRVYWNGEPVGWIDREELVEEAIDGLCRQKGEAEGMEMALVNEYDVEEVELYSAPEALMDIQELEKVFFPSAKFMAVAYEINIDGRPSVVLPDMASAEAALREVEEYFRRSILERENVILDSMKVREKVAIGRVSFNPDQVVGVEEACRILLRGTDVVKTHRVSNGQSLWSIASANNLTVDELRAANPGLSSDLLQVDQELSLVVPEPFLTVETSETMIYSQSIPFPTRTETDDDLWPWVRTVKVPGEAGSKEVTVRIARLNGVETNREVVSVEVSREPKTQVVVQGTKAVADMGTGSLAWPIDAGQITSYFGWRSGRMHTGVDIAAPTGTPIRAADSGTVVYAGTLGAYGLTIQIDHGGGKMVTLYGHNSANLVSVGTVVEKGQVIARVGRTGRASGPHVHFEVRINGVAVNPLSMYPK